YDGEEPVEVGRVLDLNDDGKPVVYITYDKNDHKENLYHFRAVVCEDEDGEYLHIILGDRYRNYFIDKRNLFFAAVLHEIGHWKCGHIRADYLASLGYKGLLTPDIRNEVSREIRMQYIIEGRVDPRELEADAFACREVGKSTFNAMLQLLIRDRKERNDPAAPLAIKEFELRKKAISKL
ncbi:MAG: hypothetical protein ACI4B9_01675, partial [Eggerthellaceae bacterium]